MCFENGSVRGHIYSGWIYLHTYSQVCRPCPFSYPCWAAFSHSVVLQGLFSPLPCWGGDACSITQLLALGLTWVILRNDLPAATAFWDEGGAVCWQKGASNPRASKHGAASKRCHQLLQRGRGCTAASLFQGHTCEQHAFS